MAPPKRTTRGDPTPLDLYQSELPLMWRPTTLRVFLVLWVPGLIWQALFSPITIPSGRAVAAFFFGLVCTLIVTTLVWPSYRRSLPAQIRGNNPAQPVSLYWFIMLFTGLVAALCVDHRMGADFQTTMVGWVVGGLTFFYRIYRWLNSLPLQPEADADRASSER